MAACDGYGSQICKSVGGVFKKIAIVEMKHAEAMGKGLITWQRSHYETFTYCSGQEREKDMLQIDKKAEEDAIKLYKEIIALAAKENDVVTKRLLKRYFGRKRTTITSSQLCWKHRGSLNSESVI